MLQSCSVPICSTVLSELPSIPTQIADAVSCVPAAATVGTRHDPCTSVTECFKGRVKSVAVTYPAQFADLPVPWRITGAYCRCGVQDDAWRSPRSNSAIDTPRSESQVSARVIFSRPPCSLNYEMSNESKTDGCMLHTTTENGRYCRSPL